MSLWVITPYFNPARYKSSLNNYVYYANRLKQQRVNLLTVELAFGNDPFLIPDKYHPLRLRSNSIMWQKERLINFGLSQLPSDCTYFAWIDADVLLPDNWYELAIAEFDSGTDILQLFKKVINLPKGYSEYKGERISAQQGVIWQKIIHKNWLIRRKIKELPFSAPGFAWAARRSIFQTIGLYDRNIVGSGDTFIVDCLLGSWDIHGYASKFTSMMKKDMMEWKDKLLTQNLTVNYLPLDIYHLYHGSHKNRKYMERHEAILQNNYDPKIDIRLQDGVFEWNSDKQNMHEQIKNYFFERREDE